MFVNMVGLGPKRVVMSHDDKISIFKFQVTTYLATEFANSGWLFPAKKRRPVARLLALILAIAEF